MSAEAGRKLISLVIPIYNEESNIAPLFEALAPVRAELRSRYDIEIVITDNHSTDGSFALLQARAQVDPALRVFRFSRNFGYQRSILTGYLKARGDAVIQLDADLQDSPTLIPEFLRLWEVGHHVVYGVRRSRRESRTMTLVRKAFYRLIDWLSEDRLPFDSGDFRLVDRRVVDVLRLIDDSQPYLRGTIATLGFAQIGVPYDRAERFRGATKFSLVDLFGLALDGILNHSVVPLRLATYVGLTVALMTAVALAWYFVAALIYAEEWPRGFATVALLVLLSLSLNSLFLGVIGEYLGRIYKQVKKRPLTVVEQEIDR